MRESTLFFVNNIISNQLFALVITWVPVAVFFAVAIAAYIAYHRPASEQIRLRRFMILAIATIVLRLTFASIKTGLQYYAWTLSDMSRYLLPPYQSIRVLLHYSWTHFWLNALISIGAALLFFIVLRALRSYNPRYFEPGEVELGFLMALIVGWPHFIVFVPVVFLLVIVISTIRGIFLHEPYTTLGLPFFLGYASAIGVTSYIIATLNLTAWFI